MERGENGFIAIFLNFKNDPACQRPFHGDIKLQFSCPWFDHPSVKHGRKLRRRGKVATCAGKSGLNGQRIS